MTYDEEVHELCVSGLCDADGISPDWDEDVAMRRESADTLIDAIPPLTLKTEDGRFVKAIESGTWTHEGITRRVFVVVEDPTQ